LRVEKDAKDATLQRAAAVSEAAALAAVTINLARGLSPCVADLPEPVGCFFFIINGCHVGWMFCFHHSLSPQLNLDQIPYYEI
jgi:hypothetical protein